MSPINNVNVNVSTRNHNYNNNDNGRGGDKYAKSREVDETVDKLLKGLGAKETSKPFLCKAVWKLSPSVVWDNYESAIKGKNPMGLFIWLCKKAGV